MILITAIIVVSFFIFFQQRISDRNMKKFERSRKRYDQLLDQLRKRDEEGKASSKGES